jgi:hypothetical protein
MMLNNGLQLIRHRFPDVTKEELQKVIREYTGSPSQNGTAGQEKGKLSFQPKSDKTRANKNKKRSEILW